MVFDSCEHLHEKKRQMNEKNCINFIIISFHYFFLFQKQSSNKISVKNFGSIHHLKLYTCNVVAEVAGDS